MHERQAAVGNATAYGEPEPYPNPPHVPKCGFIMKVLHVAPSYYPATSWGGPIFSVFGLNLAVAAIPGIELRVVSTNAFGTKLSQGHAPLPNLYVNYKVSFARRIYGHSVAPSLLFILPRLIVWADVVHLSATYSFPTIPTLFFSFIFGKPVVWTPHGALQATREWSGVRGLRRKKVWELICGLLISRNRCILHVTSASEKVASCARIPKVNAEIIPWGVIFASSRPRRWRPDGLLRLLFIGRIDPMKGIDLLLRAIAISKLSQLRLEVCGTGTEKYMAYLNQLVRKLNLEKAVVFSGHVDGECKEQAFLNADICVVPSHKENFCMAVAEALAHGVPVIASTGTPWKAIEDKGCGLWVDNSPEVLADAIRKMGERDLVVMGRRGRVWMESEFGWNAVAIRMVDVYRRLCAR